MRSAEVKGQNLQKSNRMSVQIDFDGEGTLIFGHFGRLGKHQAFATSNGVLSMLSSDDELEIRTNGVYFHRFRSWH